MLLVTWNVNSLKARLPRLLELLDEHAPEIVCLQETKTSDAAFPADELRAAGYHAAHHSLGRWAGVAILAREPPADVRSGLPGEVAEDEARWIEATAHGLRVASVYVPNGRAVGSPSFVQKLRFLDAMADRLAGDPLDAVLGDFNVTRTDVDVYDPAAFEGSTHVTPDERSRFERFLESGFADAYRTVHGAGEVGFTWWDYRQGHFHRRMGLRIDYVLLRGELAAEVRACGIARDYRKGSRPSDHAPLLARLERPAA